MRVLSINNDPPMRAYANHAFYQAIETSSDRVAKGEEPVASIRIPGFRENDWNIFSEKLDYKVNDIDSIDFYSGKWNQKMNGVFIKPFDKNKKLEVIIDKQLYSGPYANIKLFISPQTIEDFRNSKNLKTMNYGVSICNFSKDGVSFMSKAGAHIAAKKESFYPLYFSIYVEGNSIYGEFESIGKEREKVLIDSLENHEDFMTMGISLGLGDNCFYESFFSNYLNIQLKKNASIYDVKIDFLTAPVKDYNNYTTDYFLDINKYSEFEIKKIGQDFKDFIKEQIDIERYVAFDVNDNLNKNKTDERGKYFHVNLFYGYDEDKKYFYNLYIDEGIVKEGRLSFEDFDSERNQPGIEVRKRDFVCFKYTPGYETYYFNPEMFLLELKDFRNGNNTLHYSPAFNSSNYVFGIDSIKYLSCEDYIENTARDIRISHFLYEHALHNKNRIEFFLEKGIISEEIRNSLEEICFEEVKECQTLRNNILKMKMRKKFDYEKIKESIEKIYSSEKYYADYLISVFS